MAQLEELSLLSMTQTELGRGQVELILNSAKKFETLRVASMAEDPEIMAEKVNQLKEFTILSEDQEIRVSLLNFYIYHDVYIFRKRIKLKIG